MFPSNSQRLIGDDEKQICRRSVVLFRSSEKNSPEQTAVHSGENCSFVRRNFFKTELFFLRDAAPSPLLLDNLCLHLFEIRIFCRLAPILDMLLVGFQILYFLFKSLYLVVAFLYLLAQFKIRRGVVLKVLFVG